MRVALDATYAVDPQPTGVARYSQRLITALAGLRESDLHLTLAARPKRFPALRRAFPGFRHALLQEPLFLPRKTDLFHGLNQRLPRYRFRQQVVTIHDVFALSSDRYSTADFRRRFSDMLRDAVRRADHFITVSAYTRDELCHHLGVDPARVTVVHHGVDPGARLKAQGSRLESLLLSVGAVQVRKNTLAAVRVLERMPKTVRLIVAGGPGYGAEDVYDYVRKNGLGDRVEFLGHAGEQQLEELYARASLLLFPSLEEGFGLPVLEAMARGLPVVASNTSSMPEVCGDAALLVDPNDVNGLAEACRRVIDDAPFRADLTTRGFRQANRFTWEKAARETAAEYHSLLS